MIADFSDSPGLMNSVSRLLRRVANRIHTPAATEKILQLDGAIADKGAASASNPSLTAIVEQAWAQGQNIDLSTVGYGPAHWNDGKKFYDTPFPYYFFLAGFVRSQNCKRIFEIGTHFGGSTNAMLRGVADPSEARLVTVDVTDLNPTLHQTPGIVKVIGDANSEGVIKMAVATMGDAPIDLLYVDAAHDFVPTLVNLGLYILLLKPRFVVIDDIVLNDGMRSLWNVVRVTQGASAINCADVVSAIREPNVGFGLLWLR
ncbi:MAG: class I SAM-dependent methyltransferase [Rhizomicrobium sp.]